MSQALSAAERAGGWRALLRLLVRTGRGRLAAFGALVLAAGLLPTGVILATGALVRAVPRVMEHGVDAAQARPALWALAAFLLALAGRALATGAMTQLARGMDDALALEVHRRVAAVTLGTPGLEPLDDPALADELHAVHEAERRGVLRRTAASLSVVAATRLRGAGAFAILLGFRWWAPLLLLGAWSLTNLLQRRTTENGVSFDMGDGAVRLRRAEYTRSLAVGAAAAKEVRVFGLDGWVVSRYADAWMDALGVMWRARRASRPLTAAAAVALAVSHAAVLGVMGAAALRGEMGAAALLVFVQAVIATVDLGMIDDPAYYLAQSLAVARRVAWLEARVPSASLDIDSSAGAGADDGRARPASPEPHPSSAVADPGDGARAESVDVGPTTGAGDGRAQSASPEPHPSSVAADRTDGTRAESIGIDASGDAADRAGDARKRAASTGADHPTDIAPAEKVALRMEGVSFTYPGRERPTLDGLTLDVPAGQSLAIVGENGAGKSTLIKLLCGFYPVDGGRITMDGGRTPLQARGRVAVIFQDFVRYPLTLRENVAFGCLPLAEDTAAVEGALRDAGGGALPGRLPRGWETVLSRELEGGAELSGGQWQRVALARALTAVRGGAGLLILDEPTASLDVRAETELFERFLEVTRGVTTILVSHRLSSVRRADRIVVIDGGRVVEDGPHDALMKEDGRYAAMFRLQAQRFAAAAGEEAA